MKKQKKAQIGLNIFLSVIALLFIIGIIVMAFALAGAQILSTDSTYDRSSAIAVNDEANLMNGTIGYYDLTQSVKRGVACTVVVIDNGSEVINAGNYSLSNCRVSNQTTTYSGEIWYTNYTYTYLAQNQAGDVINDSRVAIASATEWFAIFITIAAVVVLILLIVLIVVSLRGAGMMGGNTGGA